MVEQEREAAEQERARRDLEAVGKIDAALERVGSHAKAKTEAEALTEALELVEWYRGIGTQKDETIKRMGGEIGARVEVGFSRDRRFV